MASILGNPFRLTSRTFTTLLADINADKDLGDKPNWFKRLISGIGDHDSMLIDAEANNNLLRTAFTRRAIVENARWIDYEAAPRTTATGTLLFHLVAGVAYPLSIDVSDLAAQSQGTIAISAKRFEARSGFSQTSAIAEAFSADAGTDQLTVVRDYMTGEKVRLFSTGTLPAPLAAATDYWVVRVDATHIRLAATLASAYAGTYIGITDAGTGTHTVTLFSIRVITWQQDAGPQFILAHGDAVTQWQEYRCPDLKIIRDSVIVVINSQTWTRVNTFIDSTTTSRHFRVLFNSDGSCVIQFGDGIHGALPGNFDIYIAYAIGGGADSNVTVLDAINLYSGGDANIEGVSNPAALNGGAEEEPNISIQKNAPLLLKARDRFVTAEDGEALARVYGGLSKILVTSNYYGVLSCRIIGIAAGGGNPSGALQTAIQAYLIERSQLNSVDARFVDATITAVAVIAQVNVNEGYTFSNVQPLVILALRLLLTECGDEIKDLYEGSGIAAAVAWLNAKWSTGFTSTDWDQIANLLSRLDTRDFGDTIQASDVLGFIDSNVDGVNYITVSSPSFPFLLDDDEITSAGAMTVTEV